MNDALKMQISAYVDGELPENEAALLLRRLSQDAALRQQVAQYLEIGQLMRKDMKISGMRGLRGRIAAALGEDIIETAAETTATGPRYVKPAAGIAIAASVAVLGLIGLRQVNLPEEPGAAVGVASVEEAGRGVTEPAIDEATNNELLEMQRRHAEWSVDTGAKPMLWQLVTLELSDGNLIEVEPDQRPVPADAADDATKPEEDPAEGAAGVDEQQVN